MVWSQYHQLAPWPHLWYTGDTEWLLMFKNTLHFDSSVLFLMLLSLLAMLFFNLNRLIQPKPTLRSTSNFTSTVRENPVSPGGNSSSNFSASLWG